VPCGYVGSPAEQDPTGPKRVREPCPADSETRQSTHLRKGVETDADYEGANPAIELGVAVRLYPGRREAFQLASVADGNQVPDAEKSAGQQHEKKPGNDEREDSALKLDFVNDWVWLCILAAHRSHLRDPLS